MNVVELLNNLQVTLHINKHKFGSFTQTESNNISHCTHSPAAFYIKTPNPWKQPLIHVWKLWSPHEVSCSLFYILLHAFPGLKRNTVVILAKAAEILIAACGANKPWNEQHHSAFSKLLVTFWRNKPFTISVFLLLQRKPHLNTANADHDLRFLWIKLWLIKIEFPVTRLQRRSACFVSSLSFFLSAVVPS